MWPYVTTQQDLLLITVLDSYSGEEKYSNPKNGQGMMALGHSVLFFFLKPLKYLFTTHLYSWPQASSRTFFMEGQARGQTFNFLCFPLAKGGCRLGLVCAASTRMLILFFDRNVN